MKKLILVFRNIQNENPDIKYDDYFVSEMDEVIDFEKKPIVPKTFGQVLVKWETNRVIFNIIMAVVGFGMYQIEYHTTYHQKYYWDVYWAQAFIFGIAANVCFSGVYLIEIIHHFVKSSYLSKSTRILIFIFGLVFSILLTVSVGLWSIIYFS